ncbi:desampylase [Halorientalis pallida]|uniref:M67 family peptidase n=1 Tax=Halorientalis pallida TaxID=2479928 RepID=A0A498KZJ8_9EURY|nr:desampylase [Halorientalis pallida]RXK46350.1 M67 family peptidase [Halorientalis pallida]
MLELSRSVYDELIAHARERAPEECCGVLGGRQGADRSRADRHRRASNIASDPETAYELDPEEQLAHMQAIEDAGQDVVGFVHSHPAGPPRPSRTDERQATWTGYSYVIVVLDGAEPFVGSWRWTGERFQQETVAIQSAESPT